MGLAYCLSLTSLWLQVTNRRTSRRILRSSKLPKDNITKEQRLAVKEMRTWKDEVILPADKGNATVVMKRSDYNGKILQLLSDPTTYRKLPKDPTTTQENKVIRVLKKLEKDKEIPTSLYNKLRPSGSHLGFSRSTNHPLHLDPLFRALSPPLTSWPNI